MTENSVRDDIGAVTVWFVVMTLPMLLMAGLVFDGGRVLSERRESLDVAQNAARAGAQAVDTAQIRGGSVTVDVGLAEIAASDYLARNGYAGSVVVSADSVTVTVAQVVPMKMLTMIGITSRTVSGTATARLVQGVD